MSMDAMKPVTPKEFKWLSHQRIDGLEGELDVNQMLTSNVLDQGTAQKIIEATLKHVSDILSSTLGPYGSTTLVQKQITTEHFATKDGYSVLREIALQEPLARTVLDIIKRVSFNMVKTVGDGSTSAVVASYEFYNALKKLGLLEKYPPQEILNMLRIISNVVIEEIKSCRDPEIIKRDLTSEDYHKIAYLSTNGDHEIANIIKSIYEKHENPLFNVQQANALTCSVEMANGMKVKRGLINPLMANTQAQAFLEAKLDDCLVLMFNGELDQNHLELIQAAIGRMIDKDKSLVICARGYAPAIKNFLHNVITQNKALNDNAGLPLVAIDIPTGTKEFVEKFRDICVYLGASPWQKDLGEEITVPENDEEWDFRLGSCDSFYNRDFESKFTNGHGSEESIKTRIAEIQVAIDDQNHVDDQIERDDTVTLMRTRVHELSASIATIMVGANSKQEAKSRAYLVEDATLACQSAKKWGYVPGACTFIPKLITRKETDLLAKINGSNDTYVEQDDVKDMLWAVVEAYEGIFMRIIKESDRPVIHARLNEFISETVKPDAADDSFKDKVLDICETSDYVFNARSHKFETFAETDVINSAETDTEILKTVISIVGLLTSSNQFITSF